MSAKKTPTADDRRVNGYPVSVLDKIALRIPFETAQMIGYRTSGGSYILASTPLVNDDGRLRDLLAISHLGEVVKLWPLANEAPLQDALAKLRAERAAANYHEEKTA